MRRVAITGIGLVSPLGNERDEFFANLLAGRSGIGRLPAAFNPRLNTRVVAAATFDGAAHFPAAQLRMLDRVSQFALHAARCAIDDAALRLSDAERERTGVYIGTGMGGGYARAREMTGTEGHDRCVQPKISDSGAQVTNPMLQFAPVTSCD